MNIIGYVLIFIQFSDTNYRPLINSSQITNEIYEKREDCNRALKKLALKSREVGKPEYLTEERLIASKENKKIIKVGELTTNYFYNQYECVVLKGN